MVLLQIKCCKLQDFIVKALKIFFFQKKMKTKCVEPMKTDFSSIHLIREKINLA